MLNVKLAAIGAPGAQQPAVRGRAAYAEAADFSAPGGSGSTFTFGSLSEGVTRSFTFEYDGGAEECKLPAAPAKP